MHPPQMMCHSNKPPNMGVFSISSQKDWATNISRLAVHKLFTFYRWYCPRPSHKTRPST